MVQHNLTKSLECAKDIFIIIVTILLKRKWIRMVGVDPDLISSIYFFSNMWIALTSFDPLYELVLNIFTGFGYGISPLNVLVEATRQKQQFTGHMWITCDNIPTCGTISLCRNIRITVETQIYNPCVHILMSNKIPLMAISSCHVVLYN